MIYVHSTGSLNRLQNEELDVKAAWKVVSAKMIRRTDRFIQLALLGAHSAVREQKLAKNTALYMASGQGNLAVFKRLRDQRYIHKQPPKPVDFINSLSNTSGFYVAQFLGIEGKNLNVSRLGFVAETLLLLAQNDLELHKESQVLLGGVDELQEPVEFTRRTLGLCDERPLGEGSNWLLLSAEAKGAVAGLKVLKETMDLAELMVYLQHVAPNVSLAFGQRCEPAVKESILKARASDQVVFTCIYDFYESASLHLMNQFIENSNGSLCFIETYNHKFRVVEIQNL